MDAIMRLFAQDKIAVIWDINACKVPEGKSYGDVAENVKKSLRDCGLTGAISMMAYGVTSLVKAEVLLAGITPIVEHNPEDEATKNQSLKNAIWDWAFEHRFRRWNLLLVLGDMPDNREFGCSLVKLACRNFNVLIAQSPSAQGPLILAGQRVWDWSDLADGGSPIPQSKIEQRFNLTRTIL